MKDLTINLTIYNTLLFLKLNISPGQSKVFQDRGEFLLTLFLAI